MSDWFDFDIDNDGDIDPEALKGKVHNFFDDDKDGDIDHVDGGRKLVKWGLLQAGKKVLGTIINVLF